MGKEGDYTLQKGEEGRGKGKVHCTMFWSSSVFVTNSNRLLRSRTILDFKKTVCFASIQNVSYIQGSIRFPFKIVDVTYSNRIKG